MRSPMETSMDNPIATPTADIEAALQELRVEVDKLKADTGGDATGSSASAPALYGAVRSIFAKMGEAPTNWQYDHQLLAPGLS